MTGIYKITNLINGKIYIGQSINLKRRLSEYSRYSIKGHGIIQRAIKKYSWENFSFKVLEVCDKDSLNNLESFYIEKFQSHIKTIGYNMKSGGDSAYNNIYSEDRRNSLSEKYSNSGNPFFGKTHSDKSKEDMRNAKRPKGEQHYLYGKNLSLETKSKISSSKKGKTLQKDNHFFGKTHTEQTRAKISNSKKGKDNLLKRKPILQIDLNNNQVIREWDSATSASLAIKGDVKYSSAISLVLNGQRKSVWGFGWRRKD